MARTIAGAGGYIPAFEVPKLLAELEAHLDPIVYSEVLRIIEKHLYYRPSVGFTSECS